MISKSFNNKVVLITGGARGIGKNIGFAFGREGAKVVICDIDKELGESAIKDFQKKKIEATFIHTDLSKKSGPKFVIEETVRKYKTIDMLVNNARSGKRTDLSTENEESWNFTMSVTLKAAFFISKEAILSMSQTGGGSIINISSVEALFVGHDSPSYHIAKAGVIQMTRYFAVFGGKYNVRVNCVVPGFIVQDEHQDKYRSKQNVKYRKISQFIHPGGYTGRSDDVANTVLFFCRKESGFITGQYLVVDGGLSIREHSLLVYDYDKSF